MRKGFFVHEVEGGVVSIWRRDRDGVQILEMKGDFTIGRQLGRPVDLKGEPLDDLRETILDLLGQGRTKIIMNLDQVRFIDSAGLGELVACKKRTLERGGDIKFLGPRGQVKDLLVMTLLTDVFEIFEDEDEAVKSFGAS